MTDRFYFLPGLDLFLFPKVGNTKWQTPPLSQTTCGTIRTPQGKGLTRAQGGEAGAVDGRQMLLSQHPLRRTDPPPTRPRGSGPQRRGAGAGMTKDGQWLPMKAKCRLSFHLCSQIEPSSGFSEDHNCQTKSQMLGSQRRGWGKLGGVTCSLFNLTISFHMK